MTLPNPDDIARLLAAFQPKKKSVLERLYVWQPLIEGLRKKGAAFEAIAAILRQQGMTTNREQIRRFCREVFEKPETPRKKPRPQRARLSDSPAAPTVSMETSPPKEQAVAENLPQTLEENRKQFMPGLPRRAGPRVANITPRNPNE